MAGLSLRRTRLSPHIRELTREVRVSAEQFVQPLFVVEGIDSREQVAGLTGVWRDTRETLLRQIEDDIAHGVKKFLLFGVTQHKSAADFSFEFTADAIHAVKQRFGEDIWLATDVCLCSYTDHGHCGVLNERRDHVVNDATVQELARAGLAYAQAGSDCVAPSDMMDGRVAALRAVLDNNNLDKVALMSYSAKFHSAFYGPFRVAADSAPDGSKLTDRASYQIDPARPADALLSSLRDDDEGADILMVKPGMPYLDVLAELTAQIPKPWAVYQTSGEAAALELLSREGLGDRERMHVEAWTAFCRAGANIIISYMARNARQWLQS